MARTIKLKESDLTKIVRKITESKGLVMEKWVLRPWVKQVIEIGRAIGNIISVWSWCCSDSRLKKNIKRVGKSPSGIPIYEFEYKNKARFGGGTFRGVLAEQTPRKATKVMSNGYRYVNYNMIDVDFEKVNPTKKIRLKESDLTNVIKNVINEKFYDDGKNYPFPGGPGPFDPSPNPWENDDWWSSQQGGGSDDPMAMGNEEMETSGRGMGGENAMKIQRVGDELGRLLQHSSAMAADISSGRNNPGWDAEKSALTVQVDALLQQAYQEITNTGKITRETYEWAKDTDAQAKKFNLFHWIRGLFYKWEEPEEEGPE